jgi:hypothetical protein
MCCYPALIISYLRDDIILASLNMQLGDCLDAVLGGLGGLIFDVFDSTFTRPSFLVCRQG